MIERDLIREVSIDQGVDLAQRVDRVCSRVEQLGLDHYSYFANDLKGSGYAGHPLEVVTSILDLVEEERAGIITFNGQGGRQNLLVVRPEGRFTHKGFTGVMAALEFFNRDGILYGSMDRSFVKPEDPTSYLNIETIAFKQTPEELVVEVNPYSHSEHKAVYQNRRLTRLEWRRYCDSTSCYALANAYDPETGIWTSTYTQEYGQPVLLEQEGEMVDFYRFPPPTGQRKIGLGKINEDDGSVTVTIKRDVEGEETSLLAPVQIPEYLLPAFDAEEYMRYARENWQTLYENLSKREPVVREVKL